MMAFIKNKVTSFMIANPLIHETVARGDFESIRTNPSTYQQVKAFLIHGSVTNVGKEMIIRIS